MSDLAKTDYMIPEMDPNYLGSAQLAFVEATAGYMSAALVGGLLSGALSYFGTRGRFPRWAVPSTIIGGVSGFYLGGEAYKYLMRRRAAQAPSAAP